MSLNFKEILSTDSANIRLDKINYNFDQLVANGMGLQGAQGAQGAAGIQGPTGDQGPQGPVGAVGAVGPQGTSTLIWDSDITSPMVPVATGLQSEIFMGPPNPDNPVAGSVNSKPGIVMVGYRSSTGATSDDSSQLVVNRDSSDPYIDNIRLTETSSSGHYYMTQSTTYSNWAASTVYPAKSYVKNDGTSYAAWNNGTVYNPNSYVTNGGNTYFTLDGGTGGGSGSVVAPVHTSGTLIDGTGGVNWTYVENPGNYVYYTLSGGTSGTVAPVHNTGSVSDGGVNWIYFSYHDGFEMGFNVGSNNTLDIKFDNIEAWDSTNILKLDGSNESIDINTHNLSFNGNVQLADKTTITSQQAIGIGDVAIASGVDGKMTWQSPIAFGKKPPIGTVIPILTDIFESVNGQTPSGVDSISSSISPSATGDYFWQEEIVSESGVDIITISNGGNGYTTIPTVSFTSPSGNAYTNWQALTAYSIGDEVLSGSSIYQCTVAGTSGGSSTDAPIGDTTAPWTDTNSTSPAAALTWVLQGILATGTATITNGVVSAINITEPGSNYTSAPTITISAPASGVTATATSTIPVGGAPLKIKTGRGKVGTGYDGWYICNGMKWTNGSVSYQTEDLCSFGINIEAGTNGQTQGSILSPDNFILGGSQVDARAIYDGAANYDITLNTRTSNLKVGISDTTNGPDGTQVNFASPPYNLVDPPPDQMTFKRIYNATYIIYLEATDLYYQLDNGQTYAAWVAATAYSVGDYVSNGGNVYYCVTAGTSAGSGGPTGTGANISDNTVAWDFISADSNILAMNSPTSYDLLLSNTYLGLINGNGNGNVVQNATVYQDSPLQGVLDFTTPIYSSLSPASDTGYAPSGFYAFRPNDDFVLGNTYAVGDIVRTNGYYYRCIRPGPSGTTDDSIPNAVGYGYAFNDPINPGSGLRWEWLGTANPCVEEYGYWDSIVGKWLETGHAPIIEEFSTTTGYEFGNNTYTSICAINNSNTVGNMVWQDVGGRDKKVDVMTIQDAGTGWPANLSGDSTMLQIGKRWIDSTTAGFLRWKRFEEIQSNGKLYINVQKDTTSTGSIAGATAGNAPNHTSGIVRDEPDLSLPGIYWKYIGTAATVNIDTNASGEITDIIITNGGSGYGKQPEVYRGSGAPAYSATGNTNLSGGLAVVYAHVEKFDIVRRIWMGDDILAFLNFNFGILSNPIASFVTVFNIWKDPMGVLGIWFGQGPDFVNRDEFTNQQGVVLISDDEPCRRDNADLECPPPDLVGWLAFSNAADQCDGVYLGHTNQPGANGNAAWQTCPTGRCAQRHDLLSGFFSYYESYDDWEEMACEGASRTDSENNYYGFIHRWAWAPLGGTTNNPLGLASPFTNDYGYDIINSGTNGFSSDVVLGQLKFANYVHQFTEVFNLWDPIYRDPQATLYSPSGWYQTVPKVDLDENSNAGGTYTDDYPNDNTGTIQKEIPGYHSYIRRWDAELGKWQGPIFDLKDCMSETPLPNVAQTPCNTGNHTTNNAGAMPITWQSPYTDSSGLNSVVTYSNLTIAQASAGGANLLLDTTKYYNTPLTLQPTTWNYYIWDGTTGAPAANGGSGFSREADHGNWRLWTSAASYGTGANVITISEPGWRGLTHSCHRYDIALAQDNGWLPWLLKSTSATNTNNANGQAPGNVDPAGCNGTNANFQSTTFQSSIGLYQPAHVNMFGWRWTEGGGLNTSSVGYPGVNTQLEPGTLNFPDINASENNSTGDWSYHWASYPSSSGWSVGNVYEAAERFYIMPNSITAGYTDNNDYWGLWDGTKWSAVGKCSDPGCTLEGTLITMADGTQKKVEDVKVGDKLKTFKNDLIPQSDNITHLTGYKYDEGNYPVIFDNAETTVTVNNLHTVQKIYKLYLTGGYTLSVSWDHLCIIKRNNTWLFRQAMFVMKGDIMVDGSGIDRVLLKFEMELGTFSTYHLDVEKNDMYFANNILTHNAAQSNK